MPTHLPWNQLSHESQQIINLLLCGFWQMHHNLSGSSSEFQLASSSSGISSSSSTTAAGTEESVDFLPLDDSLDLRFLSTAAAASGLFLFTESRLPPVAVVAFLPATAAAALTKEGSDDTALLRVAGTPDADVVGMTCFLTCFTVGGSTAVTGVVDSTPVATISGCVVLSGATTEAAGERAGG
uniref:Uncharacterized protein n=1 Tax=Cacopsylla melanoneura TaxID=428564 RepID=A0A8D9AEX8_9HEMI